MGLTQLMELSNTTKEGMKSCSCTHGVVAADMLLNCCENFSYHRVVVSMK